MDTFQESMAFVDNIDVSNSLWISFPIDLLILGQDLGFIITPPQVLVFAERNDAILVSIFEHLQNR